MLNIPASIMAEGNSQTAWVAKCKIEGGTEIFANTCCVALSPIIGPTVLHILFLLEELQRGDQIYMCQSKN